MAAPPDPAPECSVNAHATPKGVFVEVRSFGVSVLAAISVGEVEALIAALQAARATTLAMIGDGPEAGQ